MRLMRPPHLQNHAWRLLWAGCMRLDASDCHENLNSIRDHAEVFIIFQAVEATAHPARDAAYHDTLHAWSTGVVLMQVGSVLCLRRLLMPVLILLDMLLVGRMLMRRMLLLLVLAMLHMRLLLLLLLRHGRG